MLWLQTASYPQMAVAPRQPLHEMDTIVGALEQVAQQLQGLPGRSGMGLVAGAPFQFVLVPAAPAGWLLLGAPIDQALVQDMKDTMAAANGAGLAAPQIGVDLQVVIFGSGAKLRFVSPALLRGLIERGIGVETMDTAAACRTYNILAQEGRRVVAALLLETS